MGRQRLLPLDPGIHLQHVHFLGPQQQHVQRSNFRPVGMGNEHIYGHIASGSWESRADHQHLDEISRCRYPWFIHHMADPLPSILIRGTCYRKWLLDRAVWDHPCDIHESILLRHVPVATASMSSAGLCMEVCKENVLSPGLPSHPRDSKVQCARLQAEDGTIPESSPKSTPSTAHA